MVISLDNGLKFHTLHLHDISTIGETFQRNVYQKLFLNLDNGTVFVDLGAYIGDTSVYASAHKSISRIIAVEPLSENFSLLKKNVSLNRIKKSLH